MFSLQAEWQYLCRLCPQAGPHLAPVEQAIWESLILALLDLDSPTDDNFYQLLEHGVKQGGMSLHNPCKDVPWLHQAS